MSEEQPASDESSGEWKPPGCGLVAFGAVFGTMVGIPFVCSGCIPGDGPVPLPGNLLVPPLFGAFAGILIVLIVSFFVRDD